MEDSSMSSPDPLALSPPASTTQKRFSSPLRSTSINFQGARARTSTPIRNITSPSKTITMSTGKSADGSPWKIRVTVEAHPDEASENNENDPFCVPVEKSRTSSRTVRVPLRDHDASPTLTSRPRSKTPVGRKTKRSGTPVRRKRRSITRVDSDEESEDDDSRDQSFSLRPRTRRSRGKTSISKSVPTRIETAKIGQDLQQKYEPCNEDASLCLGEDASDEEVTRLTELLSPPTHSSISPPATVSPLKKVREDIIPMLSSPPQQRSSRIAEDAMSKKAQVRTSLNFTKLTPAQWPRQNAGRECASSGQDLADASIDQTDDEDEDGIEPADAEIGDRTMMESEDFSMVSLESIESARDLLHISSPVAATDLSIERSGIKQPGLLAQPTRVVSVSTTASSGEEHPSGLLTPSTSSVQDDADIDDCDSVAQSLPKVNKPETPVLSRSEQAKPPPPPRSEVERAAVDAAAMKRTVAVSQVLQQAVGASAEGARFASTPETGNKDEGLLQGFSASTRKHLRDGLRFGESLAQASPKCTSLGSNTTSRSITYPRLSATKDHSPPALPTLPPLLEKIGVSYSGPTSSSAVNSLTSVNNDIEMDWQGSSRHIENPTCVSPDSMEAQWRKDRDAVGAQIQQADPSEVITVSSEEDDSISDLQPPDEREAVATEIPRQLTVDEPRVKVSRPRLARSWRRRGSVGLVYPDEPSSGSSLQHPPNSHGMKAFWQPGTSLEPLSVSHSSTACRRHSSSAFTRADSGLSGGSSTPTLSPECEESNELVEDRDSMSDKSIPTPCESPDEDASTVSNDTGLFWHRNLPRVYDAKKTTRNNSSSSSTLKSDKIDLSALLKLQTPLEISPLRTPGHGLKTPRRGAEANTALTPGLRGVLKTPGTSIFENNSPVKSLTRVSFANVDETRDISIEDTTELDSRDVTVQESTLSIDGTMSSDVRQLHDEIKGAEAAVQEDSTDSDNDSKDMEGDFNSSAVTALSQSVAQSVAFDTSVEQSEVQAEGEEDEGTTIGASSYSLKSTHTLGPVDGYSHTDATMIQETAQQSSSPSEPGIASRLSTYLWSCVQASNSKNTSQLSHPLLKDKGLSLLPHVEPWTKTHYKMLDRLYQRYRRRPELFDPEHPDNISLRPLISRRQRYHAGPDRCIREYSFSDWNGAEMKNWGYSVKLTPSHIVVAVLFTQLLVLDSAEQYEQLLGEKIQVGDCNPGITGQELGVDKVVFRLFSVMHGEKVRRAEKRGEVVERRKGCGFVRLQGCDEWVNYM